MALKRVRQATGPVAMDAPYGLKPAGIQVQQALKPTVTTVQISEKMSNLFLEVDFPLKNQRTLQCLMLTLGVHGGTHQEWHGNDNRTTDNG